MAKPKKQQNKGKMITTEIQGEIDQLLIDIQKGQGADAIRQGTSVMPCEVFSTGSITLDAALGIGGIPRGRITEIFGPESSGKTTLALSVAAVVQKQGGVVAFIDAEHALDPVYADAIGVDMDKILISQPDSGEQALEIVDLLCQSCRVDLIIIDSVAALVPKAELEGQMGAHHVGAQARLLSQALRKLKGHVHNSNTAVIFINQLRMKIGVMFGSPETTSGGRALKFYTSIRIDIRKIAKIKETEDFIGGIAVRTKVVKNKLAPPFRQAEFDIVFGEGINRAGCIIDMGVDKKLLTKNGSHYSYNNMKLGNGRQAACKTLEANEDMMDEIEKRVLTNIQEAKAQTEDKEELFDKEG